MIRQIEHSTQAHCSRYNSEVQILHITVQQIFFWVLWELFWRNPLTQVTAKTPGTVNKAQQIRICFLVGSNILATLCCTWRDKDVLSSRSFLWLSVSKKKKVRETCFFFTLFRHERKNGKLDLRSWKYFLSECDIWYWRSLKERSGLNITKGRIKQSPRIYSTPMFFPGCRSLTDISTFEQKSQDLFQSVKYR